MIPLTSFCTYMRMLVKASLTVISDPTSLRWLLALSPINSGSAVSWLTVHLLGITAVVPSLSITTYGWCLQIQIINLTDTGHLNFSCLTDKCEFVAYTPLILAKNIPANERVNPSVTCIWGRDTSACYGQAWKSGKIFGNLGYVGRKISRIWLKKSWQVYWWQK